MAEWNVISLNLLIFSIDQKQNKNTFASSMLMLKINVLKC